MVCYLAPNDDLNIERVIMAIGLFNEDLPGPKGTARGKDTTVAFVVSVLEDMLEKFLLNHNSWAQCGRNRSMASLGKEVLSWMEYLLGMNCHLFWNVSVGDPHHILDNFMILGCLCSATLREHYQ